MISIERLRVVSHPTRRRIIDHLAVHGPAQVGTLAHDLDEQVGSVSHHLRMLERVEVVERAPELSTDGRTSWWRLRESRMSWSVDDFAEDPADRIQAKAAERANIDHQLTKLSGWKRRADSASPTWRRSAFSSDWTMQATADELADLDRRIQATVQSWRDEIDAADGQDRQPVFVFAHGFPSRP